MKNLVALLTALCLFTPGCRAEETPPPTVPPAAKEPAPEPQVTKLPAPQPARLPGPLSVLVIGDSNTEIGHITGETARQMERDFGYFGSGYHSLHAVVGKGSGYLPGLKISDDAQWQRYEMVPANGAAPKPYLSPDGTAARSSKVGARLTVEFYGDGADLYWLAAPDGGSFSLALDGTARPATNTAGVEPKVERTRLEGLAAGWHTLTATVEKGPITLLGIDARVGKAGGRRAVVHKWGKGWAATEDFLSIEPRVLASGLKALDPDIVVLLIGTNDHNLRGLNRDQFAANLETLARRVRQAVPEARLLLVSTFQVNSGWSNLSLKQYVEIWPEVARGVGARFWDMSTWFGPWQANQDAGLMLDGVHVNQAGGRKIAEALYPQLLAMAAKPAPKPPVEVPEKLTVTGKPAANEGPAKVPGLLAWWAADGPLELDAEGRVAEWRVAAGGGGAAAQARAAWRPLLVKDGLNGHPVVRFDGKNRYLGFPLTEKIQTVIFVAKTNKWRGGLLGHPYFNNRPFSAGAKIPAKLLSANYAAPGLLKGSAYLNGAAKPVGDDNADAIEMRPGRFELVSLVAAAPVGAAYLGWGGSWNYDAYFDGDVAEVLLFDRAVTDEERQTVEQYLTKKYALVP